MDARGISSAMTRGLSALIMMCCCSIPMAAPQGADFSGTTRFVFRPVQGIHAINPAPRSRAPLRSRSPTRTFPAGSGINRRADTPGLLVRPQSGSRKAVPINRAQELGQGFRPDERDSRYGGVGTATRGTYGSGGQAQDPAFRPLRQRRKPTYEELQASGQRERPPALPSMNAPYAVAPLPMPPVAPVYPSPWPRW